MKLAEALQLVSRADAARSPVVRVYLACGFTPLHLATFLRAHLIQGQAGSVQVDTGVYDDLPGNIDRAAQAGSDVVAVVLEWADLDPRLGFRTTEGWRPEQHDEAVIAVARRLDLYRRSIARVAERRAVAVVLPTLPLPPVFQRPTCQGNAAAFTLHRHLSDFGAALAAQPMVRVLDPQKLDCRSPLGHRLDLAMELQTGFPYSLEHADALGELLALLVAPSPPKKGIITDLDHTLWRGILGEDGVEALTWDLDHGSHAHALYQGMLAGLAETGVLVGVVSKNDPTLVERALGRSDLLIEPARIFPVVAAWGPKSEGVRKVLKAWNVGPESVVFVDDSPLELAEVSAAFPEMKCLAFPAGRDRALLDLLTSLRDLFGKAEVGEDDRLRTASLRAMELRPAAVENSSEQVLAEAQAEIAFHWNEPDARCFELINKTNQFNLNGRRIGETAWKAHTEDPQAFVLSVSYRDRFGPLGKIAVVAGRRNGDSLAVSTWVMSCRAFSRRIEHQTCLEMFQRSPAGTICLDFQPTERNGPCREFLASVLGREPGAPLCLSRDVFLAHCPRLYAKVAGQ